MQVRSASGEEDLEVVGLPTIAPAVAVAALGDAEGLRNDVIVDCVAQGERAVAFVPKAVTRQLSHVRREVGGIHNGGILRERSKRFSSNDAVDVSLGVVVTLSLGLAGQCDVHGAYCVGQTNHNTRTRGLQAIRAAVTV